VCQLTKQGANRLCVRMRTSQFKTMSGIGARRAAMRPVRVVAHCMLIYVHVRTKLGGVTRRAIETHIVEHLRCKQRESSPSSRPNYGIDSEGRRSIRSARARLSLLMIKSPIAYRNSLNCVHKVAMVEISMCKRVANAFDMPGKTWIAYSSTCRAPWHDCA
jgi:hypothetical protein